ncbi:hypothetical protein PMG11_07559 [Penicillium brasilianum]|uniref:DDE-1 domain-containing protein n=1 Tax=Penicillium brasilianum TaxID=104259 RepID=A0A0F7TUV2_PENBI|nr:hypothetical protein PMG11_07559 [Penicillium brasilianum]
MPKGPSTTQGRVSKTSAKPKALNASNIVALKREISTCTRQPLQEVNNPPARSARKDTCNALDGFQENALIHPIWRLFSIGSYLVIQESSIEGEQLDYRYVIDDIPDFTELHESPKGRLTEELALGWLERFHRVADGESRLLLFKGQPLFLTFNFLRFCEEHRIIPFCFPHNVAHLMQPSDLKHFSIYKKYGYNSFVPPEDPDEEKMWWLGTFGTVREEYLTPENIKHAFADRGIYPFDPLKLTQPLQEERN